MTSLPFISIIMCTYNGAAFVEEQVLSILQQKHQSFELIIVDDQSTDDTWEILQKLQNADQRIKLHRNENNLGYNKNFEKAIQLATADLIALSDQDDIWLPEKISSMLPAFNQPDVTLVHCRSVQMKDGKLNYRKANLQYHFEGDDVRRFFFFNHVMGHDAIFRSQLIKNIVPIPDRMSYDWWIAVNAIVCGRIVSISQFLVYHRIHSSNNFFSSSAASKKKELDLFETLRLFATISTLKASDREYLETLIPLLEQKTNMPENSFSKPLFDFLYKHRKIIFGHKRRLFPTLNYVKSANKYARMNYKGKGISI